MSLTRDSLRNAGTGTPSGGLRSFSIALLLTALALTAPGCAMQRVLSNHTVAANLTVADIYHQQVLDNLALFIDNPGSMPSFSVVNAGTVNIEDKAEANLSPTYSPTLTRALQGGGALPILSIL